MRVSKIMIGTIMDFKGLVIFKTIYELKSLNKAATVLRFRQSNLTAHLKKMEHECGTSLFLRNYDGVKPTKEGDVFYEFAIRILGEFKELKRHLSNSKPTLLTSELLFMFVLQHDKNRLLSTEIINKKTSEIESELHSQHYDFVITFNKLRNNHYDLIKAHPLKAAMLKKSQINDASQLPILINRDTSCPLRQLSIKQFQESRTLIEIDTLNNILSLVKQGDAVALLPLSLATDELDIADEQVYKMMYYEYRNKSQ